MEKTAKEIENKTKQAQEGAKNTPKLNESANLDKIPEKDVSCKEEPKNALKNDVAETAEIKAGDVDKAIFEQTLKNLRERYANKVILAHSEFEEAMQAFEALLKI